ncbi:MAG: MJ0307 family thioredoxin [Patescibacteria group bacterium]|nr:MAG: MJ0307 family thioredoxin [Patescibacteria group bacterium]
MTKVQFLTMVGCHNCEEAKKILEEILPDFPDVKVEEIDMTTPEGQELVQKYGIMASPGIVINGDLFSTGGVDKQKLVDRLKSVAK